MMAGGFRVYSGIDEVSREEWSDVIDSARAPAFYDYAFLRAYERAPLRETKAFYYLMSGRPAAAALPAYVQDADDALGNVPALPGRSPGDRVLLTHVGHCYDTGLPARVLTPRLVEDACAALAELAGQAGARWFAFQNVDGSTPLARALTELGLARIGMDTRFRRDLAGYASVE